MYTPLPDSWVRGMSCPSESLATKQLLKWFSSFYWPGSYLCITTCLHDGNSACSWNFAETWLVEKQRTTRLPHVHICTTVLAHNSTAVLHLFMYVQGQEHCKQFGLIKVNKKTIYPARILNSYQCPSMLIRQNLSKWINTLRLPDTYPYGYILLFMHCFNIMTEYYLNIIF